MTDPQDTIRLHHFEPASQSNGPGLRCVVWVQGCGLGCPGCFNPETHAFHGGYAQNIDELVQSICALPAPLEGVTVSGGEPFAQPRALLALLKQLRDKSSLSVVVFTGFRREEIERIPESAQLLSLIDVLIAGRYDASQRIAQGLIGSANKVVSFLSDRYTAADLQNVPAAEILIAPNGEVHLSGIDPLHW